METKRYIDITKVSSIHLYDEKVSEDWVFREYEPKKTFFGIIIEKEKPSGWYYNHWPSYLFCPTKNKLNNVPTKLLSKYKSLSYNGEEIKEKPRIVIIMANEYKYEEFYDNYTSALERVEELQILSGNRIIPLI